MGNLLIHPERQIIWKALSYAFIDREVNYQRIAQKLHEHDISSVKEIFFNEVAPACYPNIASVIPPVWTFFSEEWLEEEITSLLEKSNRNAYRRLTYKLYVLYLKWACKDIWEAIKSSIEKEKAQPDSQSHG